MPAPLGSPKLVQRLQHNTQVGRHVGQPHTVFNPSFLKNAGWGNPATSSSPCVTANYPSGRQGSRYSRNNAKLRLRCWGFGRKSEGPLLHRHTGAPPTSAQMRRHSVALEDCQAQDSGPPQGDWSPPGHKTRPSSCAKASYNSAPVSIHPRAKSPPPKGRRCQPTCARRRLRCPDPPDAGSFDPQRPESPLRAISRGGLKSMRPLWFSTIFTRRLSGWIFCRANALSILPVFHVALPVDGQILCGGGGGFRRKTPPPSPVKKTPPPCENKRPPPVKKKRPPPVKDPTPPGGKKRQKGCPKGSGPAVEIQMSRKRRQLSRHPLQTNPCKNPPGNSPGARTLFRRPRRQSVCVH